MLDTVNFEHLAGARNFLGWWKSAETHLGTEDAAYDDIHWSAAQEPSRSNQLIGAEIGFQMIGTGKLNFSLGSKDGRLHFSAHGPFQRLLQSAENTSVVLYDLEDRRAWLVPALDVMLHIMMTRINKRLYGVGVMEDVYASAEPRARITALQAILWNRDRILCERETSDDKDYLFRDAIISLWSRMERLMEKDDQTETSRGLVLHGTLREKLLGWEFMSLVHEKPCHRQKEVVVLKSSGGWVELIHDIDCLVLFAAGFKEIIKPVNDSLQLCRTWRALPKGRDFMAGRTSIFDRLYSEAGSEISRKHLSTTHLQWHCRSSLFESCTSKSQDLCRCDRTQQIYHDSLFKKLGPVRPPGKLEPDGCVIFGQAHHSLKPASKPTKGNNTIYTLPNILLPEAQRAIPAPTNHDPTIKQILTREPDVDPEISNGHIQVSRKSQGPQNLKELQAESESSSKQKQNFLHLKECEQADDDIEHIEIEESDRQHSTHRDRTRHLTQLGDSAEPIDNRHAEVPLVETSR
ncbi:MAG: hypothetical protein Q9220_003778 [cf. Caloplaca sp. 1 TL-2023]